MDNIFKYRLHLFFAIFIFSNMVLSENRDPAIDYSYMIFVPEGSTLVATHKVTEYGEEYVIVTFIDFDQYTDGRLYIDASGEALTQEELFIKHEDDIEENRVKYPYWECNYHTKDAIHYDDLPQIARDRIKKMRDMYVAYFQHLKETIGDRKKYRGRVVDPSWFEVPLVEEWRCVEMTPEKEAEVLCKRYGQCP